MLYILNDDIFRMPGAEEFIKNIETNVHQISIHNKYSENASIVLPTSTYAEINGTFVNFENRIQRLRPAVATLEEERIIGEFAMSRLDKFGAQNDRWTHGTKFNSRPGWKILKLVAKAMGHKFAFENSEEVFIELCSTIPELNGYDYETIGSKGIVAGEKPLVEAE
jgi:NADH-quinone oxidoreductase subunit G